MSTFKLIQELKPIFEAYNLRANRLTEFKKAKEINEHIDKKVSALIYMAGI